MFLSINALGTSPLISALPRGQENNSVQFIGEGYFDNIKIYNKELSDNEVFSINSRQLWDSDTVLLADFENVLEAGNLINGGQPITSWKIRRKRADASLYTLLDEIPFSNINADYIDDTVENSVNYEYVIYPVSNGTEGFGIGGSAMVEFFGWILSDDTLSYNFDLEIETDNIQTVKDMKLYEKSYTKFPSVRFGEMEYKTGSITTIPYRVSNGDIVIDNYTLNQLDAFINNSKEKILRNHEGFGIKVITSDFSFKYYDQIPSFPYKITFKWTQTGEI
jgi:hypothetical protein